MTLNTALYCDEKNLPQFSHYHYWASLIFEYGFFSFDLKGVLWKLCFSYIVFIRKVNIKCSVFFSFQRSSYTDLQSRQKKIISNNSLKKDDWVIKRRLNIISSLFNPNLPVSMMYCHCNGVKLERSLPLLVRRSTYQGLIIKKQWTTLLTRNKTGESIL